jgi:hypothetical protein
MIISSSLPIYYDQLNHILENKQFQKLNSLKIKGKIINKSDARVPLFSEKIFSNENSLHTYEYLPELYQNSTDVNNLKVSVNLRSLSLNVADCKFLFQLLSYTPNLKHLNLLLLDLFHLNERTNSNMKFSSIKLEKISLVVQLGTITQTSFQFLTSFIKQFSLSLIYLSLDFNQIKTREFQFDGFILQQYLLESMIQLKSFHLYMQVERKSSFYVKRFFSTFQTQFWLDHHWIFGMHETYLYTLPFHFDQLNDFSDFDQIKSSNPKILNSLQTWSHVKSIKFSHFFEFKSNVIEQIKFKMPNSTSISLTFQRMHTFFPNIDETNQTAISLDSVTTIHSVGEYLQAGKHLLIRLFQNMRNLILSYSSESVANSYDDYFRAKWMTIDSSYSSKIEHVQIEIKSQDADCDYLHKVVKCLIEELLNMFINIQSFLFHFYERLRCPSRCLVSELNKTIQLFNMNEFAEIYQIKHIQHYLQFIRKQND